MVIATVAALEQAMAEAGVDAGDTVLFGGVPVDRIKHKIHAKDMRFHGRFFAFSHEDSLLSAANFIGVHLQEYRSGHAPSMTTLAMHHARVLGLDPQSVDYRAVVLASALAEGDCGVEEQGKPDYHNVNHFLDVAAVTGNLLQVHEYVAAAGNTVMLSPHHKALTLIAAIIHDVGHDGKGNPKEDPFYNEKKSFETARPLLEAAGLSREDMEAIYMLLLTTSPNGPHAILKAVAKAQREGQAVDWNALDKEGAFPELRALAENLVLTQMAAVVSDSDLFASSGAGFASSRVMSANLTKEVQKSGMQMDFNSHGARKFFLENIVGKEGYASDAARAYLNANFMLLKEATDAALGLPETEEEAAARKASMQRQPGQ